MKLIKDTEPCFIFIADEPFMVKDLLEQQIYPLVHHEKTGKGMSPLHNYYDGLPTTEQIKELLSTSLGQQYKVEGINFIDFLVQQNAYNSFVHNFYEGSRADFSFQVENFEEYLAVCPDNHYVSRAFEWRSTEEGYEYWDEIDSLWLEEKDLV